MEKTQTGLRAPLEIIGTVRTQAKQSLSMRLAATKKRDATDMAKADAEKVLLAVIPYVCHKHQV
jgi:hypothetical protein